MTVPEQTEMWLPAASRIADRRRFWRARLADSSDVKLQARASPGAPVRATYSGRLLNVSFDGLACLLNATEARALSVDTPVEVSFEIPGAAHPFRLTARVRAKTPCASEETYVLGVQFTTTSDERGGAAGASDADRRRLAEVLNERGRHP